MNSRLLGCKRFIGTIPKKVSRNYIIMSSHLNWLIIRNSNAYLLKKRDIPKPFSTEPNNLTNLCSYRYNGLVHKQTLGVTPAADKKGFTLVYKKSKYANRPAKNTVKITFKAGSRRSLKKMRNVIKSSGYRKDLTKAALRRASAVIRSQKVKPTKKKARAAPAAKKAE